jgi:hypothetical protein
MSGPGARCLLSVFLAVGLMSCGEESGKVAAMPVDEGAFGSLAVDDDGNRLMTMVARDGEGRATEVTGALWMNARGESLMVSLDPVTNLPDRMVVGGFVLLFSDWRWHGDWGLADVARIHVASGFIDVHRDVVMGDPPTHPRSIQSALTCFPACSTDDQNFSELLKIAGLGISIGACGVATGISWGAAAIPCAGLVVSSAKMVVSDEKWLGWMDKVGPLLLGIDILGCIGGNYADCIQVQLSLASDDLDEHVQTMNEAEPFIGIATAWLDTPGLPEGVVQGEEPGCIDQYQCEPGHFLPCYPEGVRECLADCTWGPCPEEEKPEEPDIPNGGAQCSEPSAMCECSLYQACVTWSGTRCTSAFYRTSRGDFKCASCSNCAAAVNASIQACCPR